MLLHISPLQEKRIQLQRHHLINALGPDVQTLLFFCKASCASYKIVALHQSLVHLPFFLIMRIQDSEFSPHDGLKTVSRNIRPFEMLH
jgi:hypothetical protein